MTLPTKKWDFRTMHDKTYNEGGNYFLIDGVCGRCSMIVFNIVLIIFMLITSWFIFVYIHEVMVQMPRESLIIITRLISIDLRRH